MYIDERSPLESWDSFWLCFSYTVTVMQINYITIIMWDVFHKDSCVYTRHVKT
jgi:hypothetical protein